MNIIYYTAKTNDYKLQNRSDNAIVMLGDKNYVIPQIQSKIYKILGHLYFPNADILVWIDYNIVSKINEYKLVEKYLSNADLFIAKHPFRKNIYEEFNELIKTKRFENIKNELQNQKEFYENNNFNLNKANEIGLFECSFIIRKNTAVINELFEKWWANICRFTYRDQVSFPYVLQNYIDKIKINSQGINDIRKNENFIYTLHY